DVYTRQATIKEKLFKQTKQGGRRINLELHLVPIGYGFQGMVMLLASALNGVRASSICFLLNGLRLFVFLLPGAWLGAEPVSIQISEPARYSI
ncbi:hypothetical protein ACQ4LF_23925, partial [Aeromonas salmonicida]